MKRRRAIASIRVLPLWALHDWPDESRAHLMKVRNRGSIGTRLVFGEYRTLKSAGRWHSQWLLVADCTHPASDPKAVPHHPQE